MGRPAEQAGRAVDVVAARQQGQVLRRDGAQADGARALVRGGVGFGSGGTGRGGCRGGAGRGGWCARGVSWGRKTCGNRLGREESLAGEGERRTPAWYNSRCRLVNQTR